MNKIRVMVADDQTLMCDGLKTILENEEDIEVVSTASDGLQAFELCCTLKPDVVLMDIRMPVMDGVESTRLIKKECPEVIVIMLTTFDDDEYIIEALSYGANSYLLKSIQTDKLLSCLRDAVAGIFSMNADVAKKVASRLSVSGIGNKQVSITEFSNREVEVARLMVEGYSNKEIASTIFITEGTVKNYISTIYDKLGTNDRVKAVNLLAKILSK